MRRECQRLQIAARRFSEFRQSAEVAPASRSDLNHQIDDVLDFFAPEAAAAGVEIIRYLDPDLPRVMLDREAFRRR